MPNLEAALQSALLLIILGGMNSRSIATAISAGLLGFILGTFVGPVDLRLRTR